MNPQTRYALRAEWHEMAAKNIQLQIDMIKAFPNNEHLKWCIVYLELSYADIQKEIAKLSITE